MDWCWVVGYEGFYEINEAGEIRSVDRLVNTGNKGHKRVFKGRVLRPKQLPNGYSQVNLCSYGIISYSYVHRLMLETFVGPCPDGQQCRHKNGTPNDNRLSNLAWGTPIENNHDKIEHGTHGEGERHSQHKLSECDVRLIRHLSYGHSQREIAGMFGIAQQTVSNIVTRKIWKVLT